MAMEANSMKVPSVQELAKENLVTVPSRYVRDDKDEDRSIVSNQKVPIIDMERLLFGDSMDSELEKLHLAAKEWGFFQLMNHGVSSSLMEKMKQDIEEFFNLPVEEKMKFEQLPGSIDGYGQMFVLSEEQKLEWADMLYLTTLPTNLQQPHLFSKLSLTFRETIEAYSKEMMELAIKIINLFGKALGIEIEEANNFFDQGMQTMRMNYYPPCLQPELVMGLAPHSDAAALSILQQVNEMEGLQIKKDGAWVPIVPLPNAFVVNVGDTLEIFTNGIYRSVEHRAVVNSVKERISLGTFHTPRLDGELGPATSLITPLTPPNFKKIGVADFYNGFFNRELAGKSYIDTMRITVENDQKN